ncbi:MAG: hypothetical protein IAG10_19840, partial [Planctomycetaceae bacterium]|nr:hypothetical protein [Planctomycetaceae bacterium]
MRSDTADLSELSDEKLTLLDVACDQFESFWRSGQRTRIEDFVACCPLAVSDALIGELVRLEVELRLEAGESPKFEDYRSRFSNHLESVRAALREARVEAFPDSPERHEFVTKPPTAVASPPIEATQELSSVIDTPFSRSDKVQRPSSSPPPPQLGRYLIIRELGHGG